MVDATMCLLKVVILLPSYSLKGKDMKKLIIGVVVIIMITTAAIHMRIAVSNTKMLEEKVKMLEDYSNILEKKLKKKRDIESRYSTQWGGGEEDD